MMKLPQLPLKAQIPFEQFIKTYVEAWLPSSTSLHHMHRQLLDYCLDPANSEFIIPPFQANNRRGHKNQTANLEFWVTDHEAALWFFARACEGTFSIDFKTAMKQQIFSMGQAPDADRDEDQTEWKGWGRAGFETQFGHNGWRLTPLFDANEGKHELTREALSRRMLKLLHPLNYFPLPNHLGQPLRWLNRVSSHADFAEVPGLKRDIVSYYRHRYPDELKELWRALEVDDSRFSQSQREVLIGFEVREAKAATDTQAATLGERIIPQGFNNLVGHVLFEKRSASEPAIYTGPADKKYVAYCANCWMYRSRGHQLMTENKAGLVVVIVGTTPRWTAGPGVLLIEAHDTAAQDALKEMASATAFRAGQFNTNTRALPPGLQHCFFPLPKEANSI